MELAGQHVVVTGGASGIGRALCERFAKEGARAVVVADVDAEGAARVAASVGGMAQAVDVRDPAQIEALVDAAEAAHGPIDLFCSNAGIGVEGGVEAPDSEWQRIWEINSMAHVWAARVLVPRMLERGGGYLLNTASAAGLLTQLGSAPYSATKHAAVAIAEWLAITHGDAGLKVSVLCPQAVRTPMTAVPDNDQVRVAGVDGMIEAEEVAEATVEGLRDEGFWILPHPVVSEYALRKAQDIDRWLSGMRRLQKRIFS
ncbi:MAG: SDR family oxidoreductase [Myxococcota bacterium]